MISVTQIWHQWHLEKKYKTHFLNIQYVYTVRSRYIAVIFLMWSKFYHCNCCGVCTTVSYITALYWESFAFEFHCNAFSSNKTSLGLAIHVMHVKQEVMAKITDAWLLHRRAIWKLSSTSAWHHTMQNISAYRTLTRIVNGLTNDWRNIYW